MPKKQHPEYGEVKERVFESVVEDTILVEKLEGAQTLGFIKGYSFADGSLILWRPWVDGDTAEVAFAPLRGNNRMSNSYIFFREVYELLLHGSGHGALHSGNIFLRKDGRGFQVVDPQFNKAVLTPRRVPKVEPWMWGPCPPDGWSLKDWDLVSLLRTTALLAMESSISSTRRSNREVKETCRQWAAKAERMSGSGTGEAILEALALLETIPEVIEAPPYPIENELAKVFERQAPQRMLPLFLEDELRSRAALEGLGGRAFDQELNSWLLSHGARLERELTSLAKDILEAGRLPWSKKWVSERSCTLAEEMFSRYGIGSEEAARRVSELLKDVDWLDGREAAKRCKRFVADGLPPQIQLAEEARIASLAEEFASELAIPAASARQMVGLELECRMLGLGE